MSYESGRVCAGTGGAGARWLAGRAAAVIVVTLASLAGLAASASAGPPTCGKDDYGTVWVHAPNEDWPFGVLVPAYGSDPSPLDAPNLGAPNLQGDGSWYTHGGTRKNQIMAIFSKSGCDYPKFDFTLNLVSSTRRMFATVPGHEIDPYFVNIDRLASVPVTTDNPAFRTFCGGADATTVVLGSSQVVRRPDGYPTTVGGVLMDNYAGCFRDAEGQYYVRRAMVVQSDEDGRGLSVFALGRSTILDGGSAMNCDLCSFTSFVRVYHPDADTWVVAPEYAPPPAESVPEWPWQAAYQRRLNNNWVFDRYAPLPFAMVVVKLPPQ